MNGKESIWIIYYILFWLTVLGSAARWTVLPGVWPMERAYGVAALTAAPAAMCWGHGI